MAEKPSSAAETKREKNFLFNWRHEAAILPLIMLPKINRLIKDSDFKRINSRSRPFFTAGLRLKFLPNGFSQSRFAFVISTKVSKKSTIRNRIKRQLREIIRLNKQKIKPGFDLVISASAKSIGKEYSELESELAELLDKAKLLK